ncbi:SMI1/KNR4 family protein [Hymenobacter cellulosivorans]|uniref:SMI1/KNR4 family protein n=1 Tax=Hymenobacter cellulosivorans TaxID=2932249 RepID=A0ABY4FF39_9BACT|nr:SMI1/KNR4 family protein [Hymenobacter cellulosivorans]UOQ55297.1 SMI1/KNR4 family protein [Hymenobacter cellulosivorans]
MTSADINLVHQFVDTALEKWRQADLMHFPDADMPLEMRDEARVADEDWTPWKPIPSTVTNSDLQELEAQIHLPYPALYKEFLRYKHFYELWTEQEINFFRHGIHEWKEELIRHYFQSGVPAKLIGQGYIYFADYSDWGIVCFDTRHQNPEDQDCPIVMIDHELLLDDPVPMKTLYPSFAAMMRSLVAEQKT